MNLLTASSGLAARTFGIVGILKAAAIAGSLALAAGLWMGVEWQQGRTAQEEVKLQDDRLAAAAARAEKIQEQANTAAADMRVAADRLEGFADEYEKQRALNSQNAQRHRDWWATYFASRPGQCALDAVGLRVLNDALAGRSPGAGTAPGPAAGDRRQPQGAVPAAAGRDRRIPAGNNPNADGRRSAPVPRLPKQAREPRGSGGGT